jgi:hypothetical protein
MKNDFQMVCQKVDEPYASEMWCFVEAVETQGHSVSFFLAVLLVILSRYWNRCICSPGSFPKHPYAYARQKNISRNSDFYYQQRSAA